VPPLLPTSKRTSTLNAQEWAELAEPLADWALARLVVRRDVYGAYLPNGGTYTAHEPLTLELLVEHFKGLVTIGAHSTNGEGLCKSVAFDVDAHTDTDDSKANWRCAVAIRDAFQRFGFRAIICDSNGKGGYHVRVFFKKPVVSAVARWLCDQVEADLKAAGHTIPESFPKQAALTIGSPFGNWLRLCGGRHHKRSHWTRIHDEKTGSWLEGKAAALCLISQAGDDVSTLLKAFREAHPDDKPKGATSGARDKAYQGGTPDLAKVRSALKAIPNGPTVSYDTWLSIGMALSELGQDGAVLFHEWSASCPAKYDPAKVDKSYASFAPGGGITIGTLYHHAKTNGWTWTSPNGRGPTFSNFRSVSVKDKDGTEKTERRAIRSGQIAEALTSTVGPWPKRVDDSLFIEGADHKPVSLNSTARLFAWIDRAAKVDWTKGSSFVTQERFYEGLRMTVERFDSIETLPHFPPIPRTYYMHPSLPKPTGDLDRLLDFFAPLTDVDRELIKAFIMTPLWGGQPGSRPAFLVTGPDQDEEQGRGIGKTTLVQIVADEIYGGAFKARLSKDFDDLVTRLLTREARQQRIAMLDNLKTFNFSWGDLEDLITSSTISGRELYVGDSRRPNYLVWVITLNGATLSKDLAQRVIPVKLKRPAFKATWEPSVRTFARDHRTEILADILDLLQNARETITPATRWAAWEADVLAATINPAATQKVIVERQGDVDAGNSDRDIVHDYLARQIREAGVNPVTQSTRFNSQTATRWVNEAMNAKHDATRASGFLGGLNISELTRDRSKHGRFWIWCGKEADATLEPIDVG
jgi:Primase C terminal 2 (PriCT-2)